jgi:CHAT domain-containing protein
MHDEEIVIIPDGPLFMLPFASFYDKKSEKYLIDKHCITISPSTNDKIGERAPK